MQNKVAFEESLKENILETTLKNVDSLQIATTPEYELKLVDRTQETNEDKIVETVKENTIVTYKYYEIALNNEPIESVDTIETAKEVIDNIKEEKQDLDFSIIEKYTENAEEIDTKQLDVAKINTQEKVTQKLEEDKQKKEEEEKINAMPDVNGIKLATKPVTGTISSRYGVSSSIRSSTHTGLDIAATTGTPIQAVADGTITCASYNGAYGNLVKVQHGNGVETWYAHTSKMYVKVGQTVSAGETIAAVGSTGNSTGAHLHFEIRINGNHVNPQKYLYN